VQNDPSVQLEQGLALLGGETASADGPKAIALIDTAAANGHPDALVMSALFEAMGALRPQNWPAAMRKLRRAAELGSESARGQVQVLEERGSVDLSIDRLLAPPPKKQLHDSPRIVAYPGFAAEGECAWIIGRARDRLKPAKVFATSTGDQTHNPARDNKAIEFQLPDMDLVVEVLRARISAATRLPVAIFEPTQILHYSVGEQFRPHHDFLDPGVPGFAEHLKKFGQRIATVLIYLNDDYEGGETVFPKLGINHRAAAGDALFFTNVDRSGRGDPLTMHAGSPPTSGEKWVFSQWIRDRLPAQ
jgi:predicted 2-oxoglutarate/Fe(II)-dependent dioxygenase YbiX